MKRTIFLIIYSVWVFGITYLNANHWQILVAAKIILIFLQIENFASEASQGADA